MRKKIEIMKIKTSIILILLCIFCVFFIAVYIVSHSNDDKNIYNKILDEFITEDESESIYRNIVSLEERSASPSAQEIAYLVQAELKHYEYENNNKSATIVEEGIRYLVDNVYIDENGNYGYGLYFEWDAFGDGSINDKNTAYGITNAVVIDAFVDVMDSPIISEDLKCKLQNITNNIIVNWCENYFTKDSNGGGYFWYSNQQADNIDSPNISAMLAGVFSKTIDLHPEIFSDEEINMCKEKIILSANNINSKVELIDGMPFWQYINGKDSGNDLVHHCFMLEGIDLMRIYDDITFDWNENDEFNSLNEFWELGELCNNPTEERKNNNEANMYGLGELLYYYSLIGDDEKALKVVDIISEKIEDDNNDFRSMSFVIKGLSQYYFS